jgi:diaminopimelate epimerase
MEHTFYKYQGTGNDFIMFDNRNASIPSLSKEVVKKLCDRRFGIGADGLILLCNKEGYDFEMVYYNSDGLPSTMCGNGGRCIVKFAYDLGIHKSSYLFLAVDGPHEASIDLDNIIRLKMIDVNSVEEDGAHSILNTGSPHYVKFSRDVRRIDVKKEGREIRCSPRFESEGINVNFVESTGSYCIYVRTYERGVEDETYSCGTGVTAAALVSAHNERGFNQVQVQTNGGELGVEFNKTGDHNFTDIFLCGPAIFVFKGNVKI